MKIFAMMIIDVEDSFEDRKCNSQMMKKYLENKIANGVVSENYFRGKVVMKIKDVRVAVMDND